MEAGHEQERSQSPVECDHAKTTIATNLVGRCFGSCSVATGTAEAGSRYIEDQPAGIDGAIARIDHLRKRLDEENAKKNRDPRTGENIADEIDRIANAIIDVEPAYDWVTNTIAKPAPALVAETLRASRDTLFDLPPRKRS